VNCPICSSDTIVLHKDGADRRRKCTKCHQRFTTTEVLKEELQRQQEAVQAVRDVAERLKAA
jgi:transcriptional regulator NrdR family protein